MRTKKAHLSYTCCAHNLQYLVLCERVRDRVHGGVDSEVRKCDACEAAHAEIVALHGTHSAIPRGCQKGGKTRKGQGYRKTERDE